ncbi:MAG: alpha/beta fold hydrolase [Anaerolineae bacterium]
MTKSEIVQTARGPVEYTRLGSGPVVLVCHGTSSDCFSSCFTRELVASGFTVLTPSRPGYGRTPLSVGLTAVDSADALASLLDALDIPDCAVMGLSGGGPTAVALAACHPAQVKRLVLLCALTRPEQRVSEPGYREQMAFYGPMHSVMWAMLGLMSRLSPPSIARQTMSIFSTHDTADVMRTLSPGDRQSICKFYQGHSSRRGALNDATHTVGAPTLAAVHQPSLIVHSREDRSVPFTHAEWSMQHIPHAQLCEAGATGHFLWVGPDASRISSRLVTFLRDSDI